MMELIEWCSSPESGNAGTVVGIVLAMLALSIFPSRQPRHHPYRQPTRRKR